MINLLPPGATAQTIGGSRPAPRIYQQHGQPDGPVRQSETVIDAGLGLGSGETHVFPPVIPKGADIVLFGQRQEQFAVSFGLQGKADSP